MFSDIVNSYEADVKSESDFLSNANGNGKGKGKGKTSECDGRGQSLKDLILMCMGCVYVEKRDDIITVVKNIIITFLSITEAVPLRFQKNHWKHMWMTHVSRCPHFGSSTYEVFTIPLQIYDDELSSCKFKEQPDLLLVNKIIKMLEEKRIKYYIINKLVHQLSCGTCYAEALFKMARIWHIRLKILLDIQKGKDLEISTSFYRRAAAPMSGLLILKDQRL